MPVDIAEMINASNGVAAESVPEQTDTTTQSAETTTTETKVETTQESVPEQSQVQSFSLTDLGEYKSIDEVKAVIEKAKGFDPNEFEQFKTKAQKADEYLSVIEQIKNTSPYKNSDYKRLEQVEETNPELYPIYKKLIFGEPNQEELIKLDIVKNNPILKGKDEQIQRKFERLYPGLKEFQKAKELYESDSDEYKEAEQAYKDAVLDIELDSEKIKTGLMKEFKSIEVAEPKKIDPEIRKKFETDWKAELTKELDNVGKLNIEVKSEDGKSKETLLEIEPKEAKKYFDQAFAFVNGNNLELKKENVQAVKELAKRLWILDNIEDYNTQIAEHVAKKVAKDTNKAWRTKVHNPEPTQPQKPVTHSTDPGKELYEQVNRDLNKR